MQLGYSQGCGHEGLIGWLSSRQAEFLVGGGGGVGGLYHVETCLNNKDLGPSSVVMQRVCAQQGCRQDCTCPALDM